MTSINQSIVKAGEKLTLIPVTFGDLKVPIDSANHEKLFELLRTLRQAKELSWVVRWNKELASTT